MKYTLRISMRAVRDMQNALAHTRERFGERKHDQYKRLIRDALKAIATHPDRPPAKRRPELHPDARTFHIARRGKRARHFFIYRVSEDRFIDIARLLHDSMDLEQHLSEGFATGE